MACAVALAGGPAALADRVETINGDVLVGRVIERAEGHLTLDHPVLGHVRLTSDQITSMTLSEPAEVVQADPPNPLAAVHGGPGAATAAQLIEEAPELVTWWDDWNHRFELGLVGREGNTRNQTYLAAYRGERRTETSRTQVNSRFFLGRSNSQTTDQEFFFKIEQDWPQPDTPWFPFVRGQYDYDRFQPWEHRLQGFAGFGYQLADENDIEANIRIAGGVVKEFSGPRDTRPEGLLGAALVKWNINDQQTLSGSFTYFPNLEDISEFRLVTGLEWQLRIVDVDGLSLKIGLENEHETDVDPGERRNDLRYYTSLIYEF